MKEKSTNSEYVLLDRQQLDRMPLPEPNEHGDKDDRGVVLVIGGSDSVPGAVLLAGTGALRAGAGKLQIATARRAALPLAIAIPEALVIALPTSKAGEISAAGTVTRMQPYVAAADAVLFGPGMIDDKTTYRLLQRVLPHLKNDATLVLDSAAATALRHDSELLAPLGAGAVLTPHAGEMAKLLDMDKAEVGQDSQRIARQSAERFHAVVVLKGNETCIASPNAVALRYREGCVGLATSGSGDVLSGLIAGFAARGASAVTAAAWGVWAHGSAGNMLSKNVGPVGFLASELLTVIPELLAV